jgi:hypothetical protein
MKCRSRSRWRRVFAHGASAGNRAATPTGFKPGDRIASTRIAKPSSRDLVASCDEIAASRRAGRAVSSTRQPIHTLDPEHRNAMKMSGTDPDAEFEPRWPPTPRSSPASRGRRHDCRTTSAAATQPEPLRIFRGGLDAVARSCFRSSTRSFSAGAATERRVVSAARLAHATGRRPRPRSRQKRSRRSARGR